MRRCNDVLFASAAASEMAPIQRGCEALAKGLKCTATCTGEVLFGSIYATAKTIYVEAGLEILKHIAENSAELFLKRGVPVLNLLHLGYEAYEIGHCTINCVEL